jgi:hypothetical protein
MDDIYYAVLRVWHVLTAGKRGIVAVLVAVVVVVTVTTVFAAPTQEEPQGLTGSVAALVSPSTEQSEKPLLGATPQVSSEVVVQPYEELSIGGVSKAGLLPSSPFYFLKTIARGMTYAFTFDSVDKANLTLKYANEDVLGIRTLCSQGKYVDAAELCYEYRSDFFNSLCWVVKVKKQGTDVGALMENLVMSHNGHRLVLGDALRPGGGVAPEAVIEAITYTSAPFEYVIRVLSGAAAADEFHAKLQSDFSVVDDEDWLVIESRLGLDPKQAVELSQALGDASVTGGAPIITSVRASRSEVDPSATCVLTCMASDLDGDAMTYEWLAANGRIEGEGETVTWVAPEDPGLYKVTVVVSDVNGNQASKAVSLRVGKESESTERGSSGSFSIAAMEVEADGHSKLKPPALGLDYWTILIDRAVLITCVVDDPADDLEYDWSCDVGTLSGHGATISWEAPAGACYAQITVTVSNGESEEESSVRFRVSTCAPCFG